jgi:hypothetical protein
MAKNLSREQILRKERRLVRVPVDIEILAKGLIDPNPDYRLGLASTIPANSVFITAYYSPEYMKAFFVFGHELFDEVPEAETLTIKEVPIQKVKLNDDEYDA